MVCFIRELLVLFYRLKPSYNFVGPFCEGWNGFSCISMGTECNEAPIFFTYKPLKRSAYHFSFIFNDLKRAMKNETSSDHQRVCQFWVTSTLDWNLPSIPRVLLCGSLWGPTRHSSQEAVWKIGGGVKHKELACLNRVTKKKNSGWMSHSDYANYASTLSWHWVSRCKFNFVRTHKHERLLIIKGNGSWGSPDWQKQPCECPLMIPEERRWVIEYEGSVK